MEEITAQSVLELARGFMEPRILLTGAELDLFSLLAPAPLTAEEVCERLDGDARALRILLDALSAMGLLTKREGRYGCPPEVSRLLTSDGEGSVLPMVLHAASLWRSWSRLPEIALGPSAGRESTEEQAAARTRAFIGAMHVVGAPVAAAAARVIAADGASRMIDVGGGSGTYTIALLRAHPALRATLFDRPEVVEMARERLGQEGLLGRVELVGGSFDEDELPGGHDLALLSAIIHQNSHAENVALYGKVLRALVPGGRVVIRDHVMSPDRLEPRGGALFAVNMLAGTPGGDTYTLEEIEAGLTEAGFERVRLIQPDERMDGYVEACRP